MTNDETSLEIERMTQDLAALETALGADAWAVFNFIRGELKHEHDLLSSRVSWFITCQSFLLTVYAISYSNARGSNWFSCFIVPVLALTVSALGYLMIRGSTDTIAAWNELRDRVVRANPQLDAVILERWRSGSAPREDTTQRNALLFPRAITIVFGIAWVVIAGLSAVSGWIPR